MTGAAKIALGLFAAWAVHDAEEWATMAPGSAELLGRLPAWVPLPDDLRTEGVTQAQIDVALAIMAGLVAGASVAGAHTDGRSPLFQWTLDTFGLHGIGHLAGTLLARRYTTGSVTSALVVIPYWLWARRALANEGVPLPSVRPLTALPVAPLIAAAQAIGYAATRGRPDPAASDHPGTGSRCPRPGDAAPMATPSARA